MSTIVKVKDATYTSGKYVRSAGGLTIDRAPGIKGVGAVRTTVSVPADRKSLTRKACNERKELEIRAAINSFYTPMSEIHNL